MTPDEAEAIFLRSMRRGRNLLALHRQVHGIRGRPPQHLADVLRGALVLCVGALDALVLECVLGAIPTLAQKGQLGSQTHKTG